MKACRWWKGSVWLAAVCSLAVVAGCAAPPASPASRTPAAPAPPAPSGPAPVPASPSPSPAPKPVPPPAPPSPAPVPVRPPGYVEPTAVDSSEVTFPSGGFTIKGYLSRPKSGQDLPGLIIIHENRGLTGHMEDVARRFANQGYVALAPDLLSRAGGTAQFATADEAVAAIGRLSVEGVIQDLDAAFRYLQSLPYVRKDRIGVIGYCWGGGNSLLFATRNPGLKAAVVYYGPNPARTDDVANIAAPVLGIYGAEDTRITVNVPVLEQAMKKYDKAFEYKVYPGAAHAFFNDTGTRYHEEASRDAWQVTVSFLQKHLRSP